MRRRSGCKRRLITRFVKHKLAKLKLNLREKLFGRNGSDDLCLLSSKISRRLLIICQDGGCTLGLACDGRIRPHLLIYLLMKPRIQKLRHINEQFLYVRAIQSRRLNEVEEVVISLEL